MVEGRKEVKVLQPKMDTSDPSDHTLLRRFRSGDDEAAWKLYVRYAERLLQLAKRETSPQLSSRFDPEDIVQSVFRTFFRRAASGQYEAPEGDELWKLLLVMALNKVRSRAAQHLSAKRDVRKTSGSDVVDSSAEPTEGEEAERILKMSVEEVIQQQPESNRPIIRMRIEGYEVQAIADTLGRSKRTVERVLQNFRNDLMQSAILVENSTS